MKGCVGTRPMVVGWGVTGDDSLGVARSSQGNNTIYGFRLSYAAASAGPAAAAPASSTTICRGGALRQCIAVGLPAGVTLRLTVAATGDPRLETGYGPESDPPLTFNSTSVRPAVSVSAVVAVTASGATVRWTADGGGSAVRGFVVRVQGEADAGPGVETATGAGVRELALDQLGPNLAYNVVVAAVTGDGLAESDPAMVRGGGGEGDTHRALIFQLPLLYSMSATGDIFVVCVQTGMTSSDCAFTRSHY